MIGYHYTSHGNFKCDWCDRRAYKTLAGIRDHLKNSHKVKYLEAIIDERDEKIEQKNRRINELLNAPKPKEEPKKDFWNTRVFCVTCKYVFDTGIPRGQTIENTPHSDCGTRGLLPVFKTNISW